MLSSKFWHTKSHIMSVARPKRVMKAFSYRRIQFDAMRYIDVDKVKGRPGLWPLRLQVMSFLYYILTKWSMTY